MGNFVTGKDLKDEYREMLSKSIRCEPFEKFQSVIGCFLTCSLRQRTGCITFKTKTNSMLLNLKIQDIIKPEAECLAGYVALEKSKEKKRQRKV